MTTADSAGRVALRTQTTTTKEIYNGAVTAVVFLIFGADLIAKGLPPLT